MAGWGDNDKNTSEEGDTQRETETIGKEWKKERRREKHKERASNSERTHSETLRKNMCKSTFSRSTLQMHAAADSGATSRGCHTETELSTW